MPPGLQAQDANTSPVESESSSWGLGHHEAETKHSFHVLSEFLSMSKQNGCFMPQICGIIGSQW